MRVTAKTSLTFVAPAAVLALAATVAGLSGCGGAQGVTTGASAPTAITIRHGKEKGEAAPVAAKGGGNPATGAPAAAAGFGTLKGKVVMQGTPKPLESLTAEAETKAPICAKAGIPNEKLVLGEGNGVANVFIFLAKAPPGVSVPPPPGEPVKFDQKDCRFLPHALIIRADQGLRLLNSDGVTHNTHIYATRSDPFNQAIPPHDAKGLEYQFQKSEAKPIEVKCDIHSWMRAYQLPLDHPWGAVTSPNGEFEIKNVPAGTYKFQVWHEAAGGGGYLDRNLEVTIKPNEVTTKDIPYDVSKLEL